jgi:hypothetical protein
VGEGVLRVAGFAPGSRQLGRRPEEGPTQRDAVLGWRNRPGVFLSPEPGHAPRTFWDDGQRASAPAPGLPSARWVAVLGCSFTAAEGVRDEDTYVWRLDAKLPEVRVENLGVDGYGTYQSLLALRGLRDREGAPPDLVVYGFIGDHERRNVATFRWIRYLRTSEALYLVPPHATLEGDRLVEHPLSFVEAWPLEAHSSWLTVLHELALHWRYRGREGTRREATRRLIGEMDAAARAMGSRFLVALLDNVPEGTQAALAERGVDFVDCSNPDSRTDPTLRVGGVGHPSPKLHEEWAACLARALAQRGLAAADPS